ncbi:MAG: LysM peptidoglycan-binding domain-containing protein [bacterium]
MKCLKPRDNLLLISISVCLIMFSGCTHLKKTTSDDVGSCSEEGSVVIAGSYDDIESTSLSGVTGSNLSTRQLVEEARSLACSGALQFREGEHDEALENFEAAVMNLQLADLPEDMQSLTFLQPYLPESCRMIDISKTYISLKDFRDRESKFSEQVPDAEGVFSQADSVFIEMEIRRFLENLGEKCDRDDEMAVFVDEVENFINYYLTVKREWFERSFYRMLKYRQTVSEIMSEKRMPKELVYLAFIESGFVYRATSRANAQGIWQFINSTGKNYGLKIAGGIDERLDPIKATIAAREYLLDLIAIFGSESFLLAMASYNAGEGRVQRCLRQINDPFVDRSFWQIRDCLHRETQEYIPRIIAAGILCENPKRFGLDVKTPDEFFCDLDVIICPDRVKLSEIAKVAGITVGELRELNPDLPSGGTWTPVTNMHLYVPEGKGESFRLAMHTFEKAPAVSELYHVVKAGETLSSIGRLYKIPYSHIAGWNNLRSPYNIKPGQRLLIQSPGTGTASTSSIPKSTSTPAQASQTGKTVTYTVQKGNYLAGIGELFGVSARDIMAWNNLSRGTIYPGQKLVIKPAFPTERVEHHVATGDTLHNISKRYGVSIDSILFVNGLAPGSLKLGETLVIYKRS